MSGDKWGYIDKDGKIVINPQFEFAGLFYDGLALVKSADDKYGYIDEDGKYKINPTYKYATPFSEGLASVVVENGQPQIINNNGDVKATIATAEYCGVFQQGLAPVKIGEKWGFINKNGDVKINPQFDQVSAFSENMAQVASYNAEKKEVTWGYINKDGEIKVNYQFKSCSQFKDGLALVSNGTKYGYIDESGKFVINPQFDAATDFKNGYARIVQGSQFGFIDKKGSIVINPQFSYADEFSNDLAAVKSSDGKVGFINSDGKYVINPQFDRATAFLGDIAVVSSGNKWGIINKEGKYLVNPQFDGVNVSDLVSNSYVESDYFDVAGIVQKFCENCTERQIRGISLDCNMGKVKQLFPEVQVGDEYNWRAFTNKPITLNDNAKITQTAFEFSQSPILSKNPVTRSEDYYDPAWQTTSKRDVFDHYDIKYNDDAALSKLAFQLEFSGKNVREKQDDIVKGINDEFVSKCKLRPTENPNIFENDQISMEVSGSKLQPVYLFTLKKTS
ncbi:MAG: WG repeat-containing protein [Bacteroidetes bacterium]|nr:WG repeat-containing protein [Bacteroidota bacterium]